jgi:nucleoside-diphosphate-sugar epimerase
MIDKEKILITGATGFVGGWLAETLYLSDFAYVRAGIRNWSNAARLARFPIEIVRCDVLDQEEIVRAMDGVSCVIHCAIGSREVIVQGTNNMLEAALRSRVRRFIHLSTAEVYGPVSGQVDESFPFQYTGGGYGDAKIEAEKLCWKYYEKGLPLVVLRPPIVYGPFGKDFSVKIAHRFKSGNWGIFEGYGEGRCNLIYVSDLVSGIMLAVANDRAVGEAFNLNGPKTITWNQYFQRFNEILGLPPLKRIDPAGSRVQATIMEPIRSSAKLVLKQFGKPIRKMYLRSREARYAMQNFERYMKTTPRLAELSLYNRDALYLSAKAQHILGFRPGIDVDTGLQLTAGWINHLGLLERV